MITLHPPAVRARSALRNFLRNEASGGVLLILASALALWLANLPDTAAGYFGLLDLAVGSLPGHGAMTVHAWINDGLMTLFFLLVGLEIKRELIDGKLARPERRRLPVIAAFGGMVVPALVYLVVTRSDAGLARGWAIPAATDIAFAIAVLALLGKRVPPSLKLFLTTVAIVDDLGAVAIIALAYTAKLDFGALAAAAAVWAAMFALNRRGVGVLWPYLGLGALLWLLVFASGVHATVAGVLTAAAIPILRSPGVPDSAVSPLHRLEHGLHRWVAFAIVPLFGFANAGVELDGVTLATLTAPLPLGIALGLLLGKQAGIVGGIWLAARFGLAKPPGGASWPQLYGVAILGGIGFTMSLFIGGLAFPGRDDLDDAVKIGVLTGSLASAALGVALLLLARPKAGVIE